MKAFNRLYYFLTLTWGIITNILGALVALFFVAFGQASVSMYAGRFLVSSYFLSSGCSLGNFIFAPKSCSEDLLNHEVGHSLQNIFWGPLFLIVIGIPSFIRCQYFICYRSLRNRFNNLQPLPDYDAIWFEGQATRWGTSYIQAFNSIKNN